MKGKYYVKYTVQCKTKKNNTQSRTVPALESQDIIGMIEVARLLWVGYLQRMGNNETPRIITDFRPTKKVSGCELHFGRSIV